MDWWHILTFAAIALGIEVSPGPNFLLIMKTVPIAGRRSAYANIVGFANAFLLHGALSIFGFSVILASSASLFMTVKVLGAAYLCFLGIQAVRDARARLQRPPMRFASASVDIDLVGPPDPLRLRKHQSFRRGWQEGFITNCLNPKISLFYLSVFPQFIETGRDSVSSSFLLVMIHVAVNALWFVVVAIAVERLVNVARSDRFVNLLKGISGVALIGFGATFAMSAAARAP